MVIGNGLIGTEMKKIDKDNILFFCSGVSHSMEVDKKLFQREINLLNDITSDLQFYDTIIYFGSLSNLTNNIFLEHKRNVENQIKKLDIKNIIIRVPTIVGRTGNKKNLIPFFVDTLKNSLPVNIHETFRSILDVSDLRKIVEYLIVNDYCNEIDINYLELLRIEYIFNILSKIMKKKCNINKYITQTDGLVVNYNSNYVSQMLRELSIGGLGYTKKVLGKYYE